MSISPNLTDYKTTQHYIQQEHQKSKSKNHLRYTMNIFLYFYINNYKKDKEMRTDRTFTMIKPDAVRNGYAGEILDKIIKGGYKIVALKYTKLTKEEAEGFYAVHKGKPFFEGLTDFMSSGPIYAAILEKEDAIKSFRTFIGATNPAEAAEGTIRKQYATSLGENAIHGSDSNENAVVEGSYFFSQLEQMG